MASQQGKLEVCKADVITGLGSNERSINRVVRDLIEAELIATERGTITIRSVAGLLRAMSRFE